MTALGFGFSHNIEEEGLDIEAEGLVVQKTLCQKTEVLTELLILMSAHFLRFLISAKQLSSLFVD